MPIPDSPGPVTVHALDPEQPVPSGFVVLDVREQNEWDAGHVPGALHIPMGEVPARVDDLPDEEILVVCRSGGRSARAASWLNHAGYNAYDLQGGLGAWEKAGLPLESDDGDPYVL